VRVARIVIRRLTVSLLTLLTLTAAAAPVRSRLVEVPELKPTLIIWNARVWTGNLNQPQAEAVAIEGHRILLVGTNEEVLSCRQSSTKLVDAGGNSVLPGFIDAHFHLLDLKPRKAPINLRWVTSKREFIETVAAYARSASEREWILGEGWDERKWGGELPDKGWIDSVTERNSVWLLRNRGGAGLANSQALTAAGVASSSSRDLQGIALDSSGVPTGLIRGGPMWLIDAALVVEDLETASTEAEEVMARLAAFGVTSVHHTGNWRELLVFQHLHREGRLRCRIYAGVPFPGWERLRDYIAVHGRGDRVLHWGGLKLFRDIPWIEGDTSIPTTLDRWAILPTEGEVREWILGASKARLQIMVHAGGLRFLNLFNQVHHALDSPDLRFRIEHAHDVPSDWIPLYARAGVVASVQPTLLAHFDIRTTLGRSMPRNLFPCRHLLEAGVTIAFGTDAITATHLLSPFEVIQMALERPGPDGRRLSLEECLQAYTLSAAYAEFAEKEKGTIEAGKWADLILLDRDLFVQPIPDLGQTRVVLTVMDGEIVYGSALHPAGRTGSLMIQGAGK
jgi:predicted amidohydrolase YtcJ